ncbi:MAG: molybdopterin-dependent oxidoreductase, partial [Alicyclobacillus sp.]|nr:molybdopterin-dependent oxidoreductase [Alicyclobacillus sp.]
RSQFGLPEHADVDQVRTAWAAFARTRRGEWIKAENDATNIDHVTSYSVTIARVRVDRETGQVVVEDLLGVYDVAQIINPTSHWVQLEGGAVFGFGQAVLEDLGIEEGQVTRANLGDYKLPAVTDVPPLRFVLVPGGRGIGAENVKAVGELSNVSVMAAVANAVADAVGVRICELPVTAERVFRALHPEKEV